jgi:phytanoyl-CoA hydroxylase
MISIDLAAYERDGYLVLNRFASATDCDTLQARAAELVAGPDPGPVRTVFSARDQSHARDRYFRDSGAAIRFFFEEEATGQPAEMALNKIGHALHDLDPIFDRFSRQHRLAGLAQALGLVEPLLQSMYVFTQPRIGAEVDWHQDATYLHTRPSTATGFWIALDDADRANGCLLALVGGHRGPLRRRFHRTDNDTLVTSNLDLTSWPDVAPVALEVPRGSLVVLHGLLPQASGANRSGRRRHAYALHPIDGRAAYDDDNWLQRPDLPLRGFT